MKISKFDLGIGEDVLILGQADELDGVHVAMHLLDKLFGLAARDPQQYCKAVKQKMKTGHLTMETFDLMAHQWTLDQYEMFDTTQDAERMGEYKMAPTDFVEHMMEIDVQAIHAKLRHDPRTRRDQGRKLDGRYSES
jgi:hypothetical protein